MAQAIPSTANALRLFLIEDHAETALMVKEAIRTAKWIKLVGDSSDGEQALRKIPACSPHVVLMNLSLPKVNAIKVTESLRVKLPKTEIVWFSDHAWIELGRVARLLGVKGYIHKSCTRAELLKLLASVWKGHECFCKVSEEQTVKRITPVNGLSPRQKEVLSLAGKGLLIKEIANVLKLSPRTIETHRTHICRKLKLRNGPEMVRFAVASGLA